MRQSPAICTGESYASVLRFTAASMELRRDPEPFDWYQRYAGVKELLEQHIEKHSTILQVGCGNSREFVHASRRLV